MIRQLVRRLLWLIPVLLSILFITFLLMKAIPGSPWDAGGGQKALTNARMDQKTRDALDRRYGLDQPLWAQFSAYLFGRVTPQGELVCGLICGNLGPSYRQRGRLVQDILFQPPAGRPFLESRFGYSLRLGIYAYLFAIIGGVPLGVLSALRANSALDWLLKLLTTLAVSLPSFVVGLLLIMTVGTRWHIVVIIPTSWSAADPIVWVIPVVVLGLSTWAAVIRLTRASVLEIISMDYIRTARAKGLSERLVIWRHALRNALIPLLTFSGPALVELITGSFIIEAMFGFPGIGREYINSVANKDYSMIMGLTLVYALMIVFSNLAVDLSYQRADPRMKGL